MFSGLLVNGFTSVCLPDIEKEFGFSSKESGFILASNDISALLLVPLVSFFGGHGNKPKWIGYGALITGKQMYRLINCKLFDRKGSYREHACHCNDKCVRNGSLDTP